MHKLNEIKYLLMEELESHAEDHNLTTQSLDEIDKLSHALKNVCKIMESCDGDYSGRRMEDASYRRNRDSMGRYTRAEEPLDHSYESSYRMSHSGSNKQAVAELERLMNSAADDSTRGKFRELIRVMSNG